MAGFDSERVLRRVLEEVGSDELRRIRDTIGSRTLREALRLVVDVSRRRADLFIPHYWAVYYHDGRGGFGPREARYLIFFDDPNDDPRKPTPERASQMRRLTREEYEYGQEQNRVRHLEGRGPYMYVLEQVGPAAAHPFFDEAAETAAILNGPTIARIFDEEIQAMVDSDPAVRPEKKSASVRLRG